MAIRLKKRRAKAVSETTSLPPVEDQQAIASSAPKHATPAHTNGSQSQTDTHLTDAAAEQATVHASPIDSPPARASEGTIHRRDDTTHSLNDGATASENTVHEGDDNHRSSDGVLATIRFLGRLLDDLERVRIMNSNRIAAVEREGRILPSLPQIHDMLDTLEHHVELELKRTWRKHPLALWAKQIPGAGETLMARLIAEIGDPADRPNPAKLWAYCGHGDPARSGSIPKGATQEELFKRGNPNAKKATWKLAYQFMRTVGNERAARSPYRDIYEERKTATEGKTHDRPCARCGPSGHPAKAGSPWSDAHRHADALRIVGKTFLKDLWVEASRAMRETEPRGSSPSS